MTSKKIWATTDDGEIDILSLREEHIPGLFEVLDIGFYPYEAECIILDIPNNKETQEELNRYIQLVIKDGLTIVAVEKSTNKVCGVLVNNVQKQIDKEFGDRLSNYLSSCKNESTFTMFDLAGYAHKRCNLYNYCNVDAIMKMEFLTTLPEFRGRGVAKKLCEVAEIIGKKLLNGECVRTALDGSPITTGHIPKILMTTFSSPFSKAIGRTLSFQIAAVVDFDEYTYKEKSFPNLPCCTLEYKRL